jgi:hypothetical protein
MSNYSDSSPVSGAKPAKGSGNMRGNIGIKNDDGREGEIGYDKPGRRLGPLNDKAVGDMPNEGAPELSKKGVIGELV